MPCERWAGDGEVAAYSLRPACGERCRQADEGLVKHGEGVWERLISPALPFYERSIICRGL
ncbi:hypothetical protein ELH73_02435 [Rhizobium leguminosarum]|nr:hypothetical protein ELI28_02430 [Rhizobium leguminosarum]TAV77048.1 hypothetical protein ELI27_02430 [Rhizobium leguminosarum]TAZ28796.1 hypothetical protein ELH73_02435 [Rhizobium leguminosarum]